MKGMVFLKFGSARGHEKFILTPIVHSMITSAHVNITMARTNQLMLQLGSGAKCCSLFFQYIQNHFSLLTAPD